MAIETVSPPIVCPPVSSACAVYETAMTPRSPAVLFLSPVTLAQHAPVQVELTGTFVLDRLAPLVARYNPVLLLHFFLVQQVS